MSILYCLYKGKRYKARYSNGVIKITANEKAEGFINYIDVLGRIHDDLFMKKLNLQDVDLVFHEKIELKYKGIYFQLFSSTIKSENIEDNRFTLFTDSEKLAYEYDFEKKEQFVFAKNITKEQIEEIKIIQIPIKEFETCGTREIIIGKKDLDEWLLSIS